jgi:hypothetical protein
MDLTDPDPEYWFPQKYLSCGNPSYFSILFIGAPVEPLSSNNLFLEIKKIV